jgi:hypothetical protein
VGINLKQKAHQPAGIPAGGHIKAKLNYLFKLATSTRQKMCAYNNKGNTASGCEESFA